MEKLFKVIVVTMLALVFTAGVVLFLAERTLADEIDYGTYGRFVVSGTTIDVATYLFDASNFTGEAQAVCDDPKKAVAQDFSGYYNDGRQVAINIADHWNQGFDQLYDVVPGETTCELYKADGSVKRYICDSVDRNG